MGAAPTANDDGQLHTFSPGQASIPGLTVEDEGITPVYIWLKDKAGNVDYTTAISVPLKYDITPPVTTLTATGTQRNTYYITPATIQLAAEDATAGVMHISYRIDLDGVEGEPQIWDGESIILDQDGTYTITYYAVDLAQNVEVAQTKTFKVDLHAPVAIPPMMKDPVTRLPTEYASGSNIIVSWSADDGAHGSGIARYTVQYRRGGCSTNWQNWQVNTANTEATFSSLWANNFHYFRVRAEDKAGHVSEWSPISGNDAGYVYSEGLTNPRFNGSLDGWMVSSGSKLPTTLVYAPSRTGSPSHMALLGQEVYDPEHDAVAPNSYASLYQIIQLPTAECDHGLMLTFWANMKSWDIAWSDAQKSWYDTLDVLVSQADGSQSSVVLRYGRFNLKSIDPPPHIFWQSGWVRLSADLTQWAGQRVRIEFRLYNRVDGFLPSWAFIDDVQLVPAPGRTLNLPLVTDLTHAVNPKAIPGSQSVTPSDSDEPQTGHSIPAR
jgi:hypothetical protein